MASHHFTASVLMRNTFEQVSMRSAPRNPREQDRALGAYTSLIRRPPGNCENRGGLYNRSVGSGRIRDRYRLDHNDNGGGMPIWPVKDVCPRSLISMRLINSLRLNLQRWRDARRAEIARSSLAGRSVCRQWKRL
jgi:hypothetical protein